MLDPLKFWRRAYFLCRCVFAHSASLGSLKAVVFVDCLFRYPPGLEDGAKRDGKPLVWFGDHPVTLDLLLELPNVAGGVTSFTEPFHSAGPPFRVQQRTSFLKLFQVLRCAIGAEVPFFLWTFPGFREQYASHPTGITDLALMERIHRYALQREGLIFEYLQPTDQCLDANTGRVRSEFLGDGFHANDAFGQLAFSALMAAVNTRLHPAEEFHGPAA